MNSIYDFKAKSIDGKIIDFSIYKGKVLLIVNTATGCGFTQYNQLEEICSICYYSYYVSKGCFRCFTPQYNQLRRNI